ncbi:hypothetical protein UA08_02946 [Talaromyces atroroseus]|uniref:Uncharacterized protein n=1 Tax=Talaromyces atroroseus TaxID=1441469 RepID=A0A225B3H1_TALAT|nr:hypothetical protein UA08_02946 [Talaromyces atroroseus]OKL62559.1 hypothetical protein UA08_02946 [Talaromyces atroroseus]
MYIAPKPRQPIQSFPKIKIVRISNVATSIYIAGTLCLALGLNSFLRPTHEYPRFGLPLETQTGTPSPSSKTNGSISPLVYIKAIRETTYGLALIVLQYQGQEQAVTSLLAVLSLAGLGDGFVVWNYGQLKTKALGHWVAFVGFLGWAWWRATY